MRLLKRMFLLCWLIILSLMLASPYGLAQEKGYPNLSKTKELIIKRGYSKEALQCIECHSKKTPGIVENWKSSRMAHAGVSCYDCHTVKKSSPMASQCEGVKGTNIFTSPMVSPKTCARCHPKEVEQFSKSGHAKLASAPVEDKKKFQVLMYSLEAGKFAGAPDSLRNAARQSGCRCVTVAQLN